MVRQLPTDCLLNILEILEDDKITLHSCLLVNRHWCKISVRLLWKNFLYIEYPILNRIALAILGTLVACLPNESKELLNKNEIFIPTPTSRPPLFNYVAFCKVLPIYVIGDIIDESLNEQSSIIATTPGPSNQKKCLVENEILKMFMNQISSLKVLIYYPDYSNFPSDVSFINSPGARDCLTDLSELRCNTAIHSEVFYKLSQICHNLQSLSLKFKSEVTNELKEFISSQNNLKDLTLFAYKENNWEDIIPALTNNSNTLTKLYLYSDYSNSLPLSFISSFSNLQELKFSFVSEALLDESFNILLQHASLPKLQTLEISQNCPIEFMMKFLEINGKNLKKLYINGERDIALKLSIAKFCLNLKTLYVRFSNNESLGTLKTIFDSCQYLECIKFLCGGRNYSSAKEVFKSVAKYSPKSLYELKICNVSSSRLNPGELESFFISWKDRTPMKSLNLIILNEYIGETKENMKIIEKYINLGVIKTIKFEDDEDDHEDDEEEEDDDDDGDTDDDDNDDGDGDYGYDDYGYIDFDDYCDDYYDYYDHHDCYDYYGDYLNNI